jgi:hypothetical protein
MTSANLLVAFAIDTTAQVAMASAVVSKSEVEIADYRVRIFNPDGSEAGLSATALAAPRLISISNECGQDQNFDSSLDPE